MKNKPKFEVTLAYEISVGLIRSVSFVNENERGLIDFSYVENDEYVRKYNEIAQEIFNSFYLANTNNVAMWFNTESLRAYMNTLLNIHELLKARLEKINDGSYCINDLTKELLIKLYESTDEQGVEYKSYIPKNEFIDGKKAIYIKFEYLRGPLKYLDEETARPTTGLNIIDNDDLLIKLNKEASTLHNTYYGDFKRNDCYLKPNPSLEKNDKYILIDYIDRIKSRLNDINDGSFVIIDEETERLKNL